VTARPPQGTSGTATAVRTYRKVNDSSEISAELAPYAAREERSRGRRHPEPKPDFRGEYQRDRDRIIHSNAFRRLVYKTQVFVNHEGDLYRTRITHSIEVAQIGRSIARALRLNETLTEAISLAHDLGHTPFGHAGQDALNACMRPYGGFEHNLQSLRVVDELEERYAEFHGLNLTFECREGILKHCSMRNARQLGELGERFIRRQQPSLEAQIANLSDEIAYNNHDVDDGLRAGLIDIQDLHEVRIFERQHAAVLERYPQLGERKRIHETIRRMINFVVVDLIRTTERQLADAKPASIEEVRERSKPLVSLSEAVQAEHLELKAFLRERVYRHHRVLRMTSKARRVLTELFEAFLKDVNLMPPEHREAAVLGEREHGARGRARAVADYVAGMTDRYAILEHQRLFDPAETT
jgi:dGTPase